MAALLVGGAACAETTEPAQDDRIEALRTLANAGDALAHYNLGYMYSNGAGVPQDGVEAVAGFRQAAEQGDARAQHNLGVLSCALGFSWTLDCERVLAGGVSR